MSQQPPQLAVQLGAAGVPIFPCWDTKQPAIKGGFTAASVTPGNYWPSDLIGIPIPDGIVIIDVDAHKGMTTGAINAVLGADLNWTDALIQYTPSGGAHYAFQAPAGMRQGSDLFSDKIGKGFDTRVTGRGYICAGGGYVPGDALQLGALRLSAPAGLPELPLPAIEALTVQTAQQHEPAPLPAGDRDADEITAMLRCIDADCPRSEWLNVALALKHHYHDDDNTGWVLFDNWSKSAPTAYDPTEARKLWHTIKPQADNRASVTLGSLAHKAIQNGYVPSSVAGEVFGTAAAPGAPLSTVEQLIAQITAEGGNVAKLDDLTSAIRLLPCNDIQRAALRATLQRTLRDHSIRLTEKELKDATTPPQQQPLLIQQPVEQQIRLREIVVQPIHGLTGDHRCNAEMLRQAVFGERLARFNGELYWWTGVYWERPDKNDVNAAVSASFSTTGQGKTSNIDGTHKQLVNVARRLPMLAPASEFVFFQNGVLNPRKPNELQPHAMEFYNNGVLSVDYTPGAEHPEWDKFLHSIFHAEPQRAILLQEMMGWCLISSNMNIQKALAFDGASRGGKGSIIDVIRRILGISMTSITFGELHSKQTLSDMRNAMLAVDSDAKRPDRVHATAVHSRFNRVTANEPIDIKINYQQDNWTGVLNCKLLVGCNGIPILADDSSAAPRRWIILKFTEDFTGREDLSLGMRLARESAAIAAWAVEGLKRLMVNGQFTLPQSSLDAIREVSESSSPLLLFVSERLTFAEGKTISSRMLWDSYRKWCGDNNIRNHLTQPGFSRFIKQILIERGAQYGDKIHGADGRYRGYRGLGLTECTDGVVTPISAALASAPKPGQAS